MSTVTRPSGFRRGSITPDTVCTLTLSREVRPLSRTIAHEAARAVAALLDLAAVGVVDHVFEIDSRRRRRPHRQHLVGADAEVPVRQEAVLARREAQRAARFIEHDEVVAGPLHLGETDAHGRDYPRASVSAA